jgi:hypothetical protein
MHQFFLALCLSLFCISLDAQEVTAPKGSAPKKEVSIERKPHSPLKAALFSTFIPGLGQIYNRKIWKVGILAAGAAGLYYGFDFNQSSYKLYKSELIRRQTDDPNLDPELERYSDSDLNELQDIHRRYRDMTVIGFALLYAINIVDAAVDAHLYDFNVNDNLSLRIRPAAVASVGSLLPGAGMALSLRF